MESKPSLTDTNLPPASLMRFSATAHSMRSRPKRSRYGVTILPDAPSSTRLTSRSNLRSATATDPLTSVSSSTRPSGVPVARDHSRRRAS